MLRPGTPVEGSSDPKTVEQIKTLQSIQNINRDSSIGGQYAGMVLWPDGTLTADRSEVKYNADWQPAYYKAVFEARGKPTGLDAPNDRNGGYIVSLGVDGVPNQTIGCSAEFEQTNAERIQATVSPAQAAAAGVPIAQPATNPIAHQPAPVPSVPIVPPQTAPPAPAVAPSPVASLGNVGPIATASAGGGAGSAAAAGKSEAGLSAAVAAGSSAGAAAATEAAAKKPSIKDVPWWLWLLLALGFASEKKSD